MNSKIKSFLSIILSIIFICLTFMLMNVTAFAEDSINDYLTYEIIDGNVTITKCNRDINGHIEIPDSIDGYPVTAIGDEAFYNCTKITSVTIPASVEHIGTSAFYYCWSLVSVDISDGVKTIGTTAFFNCDALWNIRIPGSVESIGADAFFNTAAYNNKSNWKMGVLYIDNYLIEAEQDITVCDIAVGTTAICNSAFSGCKSLTEITIPNSVKYIGSNAFFGCTSLKNVVIKDGVIGIGNGAFNSCHKLESVSIPDSVTQIGEKAFYICPLLKSVAIPASVIEIGDYALGYTVSGSDLKKTENFKIFGQSDSTAERYALTNGIMFTASDDSPEEDNDDGSVCSHNFVAYLKNIVDPTCTQDGISCWICTNCEQQVGDSWTQPATGHQFNSWYITCEPTSTQDGIKERVCSICGFSETSVIEKIATSGCAFKLDMPDTVTVGETFDVILSYDALKIVGYGQIFLEYDVDKIELVSYEWLLPDEWFNDDGDSEFLSAVNGNYNDREGNHGTYMSFVYDYNHEVTSTEIIKLTYTALEAGTVNLCADYDEWSNSQKPLAGTAIMTITESNSDGNDYDTDELIVMGDVDHDGRVTAADARIVLRLAANLSVESYLAAAIDVNYDGKLTASDARLILRVAARLDIIDAPVSGDNTNQSGNETNKDDGSSSVDNDTQLKNSLLSDAAEFAARKDYANAILTVRQAIVIIGNDYDLIQILNNYQSLYVTDICVQVDLMVNIQNYEEATILINNALEVVPDNSVLTEKLNEVQNSQSNYLVDVLNPYESNDFEEFSNGKSVMMGGIARYNGFMLNVYGWNGQSCAIYNLNSKYSRLTGIVGYIDNKIGDGKTWNAEIYADGILVYTCTVSPGDLPQEFSVDVSGVKKLEFRAGSTNGFSGYIGFAEVELDGSESSKSETGEKAENTPAYLVDIMEPYASNDFEEFSNGHSVMMGGTARYNGFMLNAYGWNGQSCAVYNLDSKYTRLSGIIGYIDNKTGDGKTWNAEIYADGILVYTCTVSPGDLPQEFSVDVSGVKKLEFRAGSTNGFTGYIGFADIVIS